MLGLYGMLNMGARALQAQRTGTEVAGHNIANVNNPAYSRQRLTVATSLALQTQIGQEGTGVSSVAISQIRNALLDSQIETENSVSGSLNAQQSALDQAQAALGLSIDQSGSANGSSSTTDATGGQHGIGDALTNLFTEFQNLSNDPSSLSERQVLLSKAADLATKFNQVDARIGAVQSGLTDQLNGDVKQANDLLSQIADLNKQISAALAKGGTPNDLVDARQDKLEQLANLAKVDTTAGVNGAIDISINGTSLVSGSQVADPLQTYDAGGGQILVGTQSGASLTLSGGQMQGIIDARDGAIANLRESINTLASNLITEVNQVHSTGFGLTGSSGAPFFTGSNAADIAVNSDLTNNPALLQASGTAGANGDNQVVLQLAKLVQKPITGLGNQTLTDSYTQAVTAIGQAASTVDGQVEDQKVVQNMLTQQRQSVSGVSLDEEMTDMLKYQKAFEASAKIISTVDQMLSTVIGMKQ